MQVSDINNVKIYNLSVGKSLPEWLPEKKRRALLKKNVDLRRRIEIIQDFDMPDISTSVQVTPDGQSIIATGIYKPRVKCFDVNNLSQKFDRCFDSEAVTFEILTDDYSKLVFLQCDRYVEFHVAHGRHYRLRIPKFGTDMKMFFPTADLFIVGVTPNIYRLNLERGQFLTPFTSEASQINKCVINKEYKLIFTGSKEGKVDCWDPRSRDLVATLDCALNCVNENSHLEKFPSITAMNFDGGLNMAVGTANGLVLLYDIRSDKPYFIKDHMEELPIKDIAFNTKQNLVFSMNKSIVKMWEKNTGKPYSHIMGSSHFNNLCVVPETGLLFIANESPKIQTYYIPSIGPAPRWASFLDSLTEELEESNVENVYDDYKFVTKSEVAALGLDIEHLKRNNLLRAYMHGYFMNARLYKKAIALAQPFAFEEYRKKKIKETIEKDRGARIKAKNLPQVNKELALKLMEKTSKTNKNETNVLNDDRFKSLFSNPDFEIDPNSEEYRLINPVLSKMDKAKQKKLRRTAEDEDQAEEEEELEGKNSSEESSDDEFEETIAQSSEDEVEGEPRKVEVTNRQPEEVIKKRRMVERDEPKNNEISLGDLVQQESSSIKLIGSSGNREMTFSVQKKKKYGGNREERLKKHLQERKSVSRSMKGLKIGKKKY